ncbi:MAG TPA: hypothetical protein VGP62_03865 [Bryobacteraceae bacterium]|nr:hypothetical protein [Bryobacteraceae bacterium]
MKAFGILIFATLLNGQTELPKDVLQLSQIRREIGKSLDTLDNYTCVETINREERKNERQRFQHVDTVNVEVAVVNDHELYSWPGAHEFDDRDVGELVGGGLISTGGFRSALNNVFISNGSTIRWHGNEEVRGRRAIRWDYTIPYNLSRWHVQIEGRGGRVSETGSFWVDAETLEVLRLETAAQDIPPDLRVKSIRETLDYARMRVRGRELLLPQSVETSVTNQNGVESRNRIEFSHCREFGSAAELTFKEPKAVGQTVLPVTELQLPAGVEVSIQTAQRIDSRTATVGDRITAIVYSPVHYHRAVLIPKGAQFEGRIRRVERQLSPRPYYLVGLEFTDIEFQGHHARFFGEMLGIHPVPGLTLGISTFNGYKNSAGVAGTEIRSRTETEITFKVPGVSTFFMEGRDFRIPEGMQMTWVTTKLGK